MLKKHPITSLMKTHANLKKIILIRVFWFKYIFPIKFKILILDLIVLQKNSVPFEGLYYSSLPQVVYICMTAVYPIGFHDYDHMQINSNETWERNN